MNIVFSGSSSVKTTWRLSETSTERAGKPATTILCPNHIIIISRRPILSFFNIKESTNEELIKNAKRTIDAQNMMK